MSGSHEIRILFLQYLSQFAREGFLRTWPRVGNGAKSRVDRFRYPRSKQLDTSVPRSVVIAGRRVQQSIRRLQRGLAHYRRVK
jgi:hypothetical protein